MTSERGDEYNRSYLHISGDSSQYENFRENWEKYFSVSSKYNPVHDILDEFPVDELLDVLKTSTITKILNISIPVVAILLAVISGLLAFQDHAAPVYDGSTDSSVSIILYIFSIFGLNDYLTGNQFLLSPVLFIVIALLERTKFSFDILRKNNTTYEKIRRTREGVRWSKQIYVGSGQISFSFGDRGFVINSNNLGLRFDWKALSDEFVFIGFDPERDQQIYIGSNYEAITRTEDESVVSFDNKKISEYAENATHLLVYLKETQSYENYSSGERNGPYSEFIVLPKEQFFGNLRDATPWIEFCTNLISRLPTR